uniref:extensin-like domain-containing protein n=1 Tax=Pararhizobium sp. IMCC3301 TaxID=3067904 RepID=UPI0027406ED9|nr:extensin family protein [Pararhizobium sp. IMCC3301]
MIEKSVWPQIFLTVALALSSYSITGINTASAQQSGERRNSVVTIFNRLKNDIRRARGQPSTTPQTAPQTRTKRQTRTKPASPAIARAAGPVPRPRPRLVAQSNAAAGSSAERTSIFAFAQPRAPQPLAGKPAPSVAAVPTPPQVRPGKPLTAITAIRPVLPKSVDRQRVAAPLILAKVSGKALRSSCPKRQLVGLTGLRTPQTVKLSPQANVQRPLGLAAAKWVETVVQPSARKVFGSDIVSLRVAASFACRARNGVKGAKLSEHGYGNAIDISAFTLANGKTVTVAKGWNGPGAQRQFLRAVNAGACRYFTTVLGPKADRYHQDHFHLDLARHGKSGTYRICK